MKYFIKIKSKLNRKLERKKRIRTNQYNNWPKYPPLPLPQINIYFYGRLGR
jgi:hypothetical protein